MRLLFRFAAVASLAAAPALAATSFSEAGRLLDGRWRDPDGFVLKVDHDRAQASVDGARPFHWQRFLIKGVDGKTITFSIGADIFEARIGTIELTLTGTSFRGERELTREPELRR